MAKPRGRVSSAHQRSGRSPRHSRGPSTAPTIQWPWLWEAGRTQTLSLENITDGLVGDSIPQIGQCADDAIKAPGWILGAPWKGTRPQWERDPTRQLPLQPVAIGAADDW